MYFQYTLNISLIKKELEILKFNRFKKIEKFIKKMKIYNFYIY